MGWVATTVVLPLGKVALLSVVLKVRSMSAAAPVTWML
jgi:hypothetical protein